MRRLLLIVVLVVAAGASAGWLVYRAHQNADRSELTLFGNIDLRQVDLAFNNSERIEAVLVQEGDHVKPGQLLAALDTSRLKPEMEQVAAQVAAQRAVVERLHNGSRPEEIAEARAQVAASQADTGNAKEHFQKLKKLNEISAGSGVSQDELDTAKAMWDSAAGKLDVNQKLLDLAVIGPRKEDIAQGEAQLKGIEAQLALLQQELRDANLYAPVNPVVATQYVVRTRLMEPGDMSSPIKPIYTLAITDPKWVRAYVSEPDLGYVHPGMKATVTVDSFPGRPFEGWIGFVSPMAEFTPKPVQTEELRSSLVYEVRVFVKDPDDDLRLGMPATVRIPLAQQETPAVGSKQ